MTFRTAIARAAPPCSDCGSHQCDLQVAYELLLARRRRECIEDGVDIRQTSGRFWPEYERLERAIKNCEAHCL